MIKLSLKGFSIFFWVLCVHVCAQSVCVYACVSVHVCVPVHVHVPTPVSSLSLSTLYFEARSLTGPEAHWFSMAG